MIKINQNAIFIADAHSNTSRPHVREFLRALIDKKICALQLFFVGDMFDFLTNADFVREFYTDEIAMINELSKTHEIYYFEGNHDFILRDIFPLVKIYPNRVQPVVCEFFCADKTEQISIAHGDIYLPIWDKIFIYCMRSAAFIFVMNLIDRALGFVISRTILRRQNEKILYRKLANFREIIAKKIDKFHSNFIIEGHYHQGQTLNFGEKTYFNLKSFAQSGLIYKLNFNENKIILDEIDIFKL